MFQFSGLQCPIRSCFFSYSSSEDLFGCNPGISTINHTTKEFRADVYKIKETTNLTRNADLYASEILNKTGRHLNSVQIVSTL